MTGVSKVNLGTMRTLGTCPSSKAQAVTQENAIQPNPKYASSTPGRDNWPAIVGLYICKL